MSSPEGTAVWRRRRQNTSDDGSAMQLCEKKRRREGHLMETGDATGEGKEGTCRRRGSGSRSYRGPEAESGQGQGCVLVKGGSG